MFCNTNSLKTVPALTIKEARERKDAVLIDVRRPDEFNGDLGHIEGAQFFTLETDLEGALQRLPKDKTYIFVCRSGGRSGRATEMAVAAGFKSVFNMEGGMLAWNAADYPVSRG